MRARLGRSGAALLLAAIAISVPCVAWYVTGVRSARQEAARLELAAIIDARDEAQRLAQRLAVRLEALRHSESQRSFTDYSNLDQLSMGDCAYELQVSSPLAHGSGDPLIWTHFEVDEVGQLSLPSLTLADEAADPARDVHSAIFDELECVNEYRKASAHDPPAAIDQHYVRSSEGAVTIGPFRWHAARVEGQPALFALREVSTPRAVLTQGFAVLSESLVDLIDDGQLPVQVLPGEPSVDTYAWLSLDQTSWHVSVDAEAERAAAVRLGREEIRRFHGQFGIGLLAAMLTGALVVGLVLQTERYARQRSRFAASAAHELRTPLAGLRLYGEMLAEGKGDPNRRQLYARRIADEADRLGRVVTNVLDFSQLERDGLTVEMHPGNLTVTVRESLGRLRPAVEAHGARIEIATNGELAARFDADAVYQMLQNLIDNAEKYSRSASDRTIRVELGPGADGSPILSVTDHGSGVPAGLRRKLFRPFTRLTDPDGPAGLGLGLAVVRALAELQGASVRHTDVRGGGSRFSIRFQAAELEGAPAAG